MEDSSSKKFVNNKVKHLDKFDIDGMIFRKVKVQVPELSEELAALLDITAADARALNACQISHPNILQILLTAPTKHHMYHRTYVVEIKGKLTNYLKNQKNRLRGRSIFLPSETLLEIMR
jgi:hypothetical protein